MDLLQGAGYESKLVKVVLALTSVVWKAYKQKERSSVAGRPLSTTVIDTGEGKRFVFHTTICACSIH